MHVPQTEVILRFDGAELARVTVPPGEYVIGRSPEADIYADTPLLSRRHARLAVRRDHIALEDLGSSNGTFVDDQAITGSARLSLGQSVRLGDVQLGLLPVSASAPPRGVPEELLSARPYAIGNQIARGGMGAILAAQQGALKRPVAMKVMLNDTDPDSVRRFVEEAQVTGQLTHPNIVPIHELGVDERGQVFYTMKMVRGITLKKVIELLGEGVEATKKKYPLPALLTIFQKACDAVAFAHAHGVIHRDLKPENIMLGDYGEVLVMDWGLAKRIGGTRSSASQTSGGASADQGHAGVRPSQDALDASGSTLDGTIMGTPAYMAPEQARGEIEALDARSDIYALGAILFELLHLRPTVSGRSAMEIVDKVGRGEVAVSDAGRAPDSLAAVVRKAMALDQAARYRAVEDLQHDLTAYQSGFATSAEDAGAWKQIRLLVKRHKAASIGIAGVLLVGLTLGTKVILEGQRAEREAVRATRALTDLKRQAPALRQLAETEAGFNHFDAALDKLDAAITLDPDHLPSYWRRAWMLLGAQQFDRACEAIRRARDKDPANARLAAILPVIERIAAAPNEQEAWRSGGTADLRLHLLKVGADAELAALASKLRLGSDEKVKIVRRRMDDWVGAGQGDVHASETGVSVRPPNSVTTIEPLRGLPIDDLVLDKTEVRSLEPLQGMESLTKLLVSPFVTDLSPLRGLRLRRISLWGCPASDLSPLAGMPLEEVFLGVRQTIVAPLKGAPIRKFTAQVGGFDDLAFLADSPLDYVNISEAPIKDLRPLSRTPVRELHLSKCPQIRDLSVLLEAKILERLTLVGISAPVEPLRRHPSLQFIRVQADGKPGAYRPVAEFWAEYDAQQKAAGAK